jgi:hypothetical protein
MSIINKQLFQSSGSGLGAWVYIGDFDRWSVHVDAAEAGAVLTVELSNLPNESDDPPPSSYVGSNMLQELRMVSSSTGGVFGPALAKILARWIRVTKTAGGSPVISTAYLHGHSDVRRLIHV